MEKLKKYLKDKALLRYLLYAVYIILTLFVLFSFLKQPYIRDFISSVENKTFDVRQKFLALNKQVNKDLVILSIDDASYEYLSSKYGEWPISRKFYADLIEYTEQHKPSAIAFDLLFVHSMKNDPVADKMLASSIASYDNVFTSINFDDQSFALRQPQDLPTSLQSKLTNLSNINFADYTFSNCRVIISEIMNSTANIGHINLVRSTDGIARDMAPFILYKDNYYPHLALKVAMKYLAQKEGLAQNEFVIDKNRNLHIGSRIIPMNTQGSAYMNWYGQSGLYDDTKFTYIPMWKVEKTMYEGANLIPQDFFKDKIVYVGTSATSAYDLKSVPTGRIFPGVEIHTTFINNLLDNNFIKKVTPLVDIAICLFLSLCVGFFVINCRSTVMSSVFTILTGVIYIAFATAIMFLFNLWVGIFLPLVSILLVFIACYIAKYIITSKDLEYTYALATTDGLTELYNHRYFQEQMLQNIETGKRYDRKFSLIMIDIDYFKKFNDTYGHQSGDAVLRQVAQILKRNVRSTDVVCRYGGEEMAIILTQTGKDEALFTAQKICNAISAQPLKIVNGNEVNVTISLGVSTYLENGETTQEMIKYADDCLYAAKENGRNQVGNYAKENNQ